MINYFVIIDKGDFTYAVKGFKSLEEAYRFYLEDTINRKICREIKIGLREING